MSVRDEYRANYDQIARDHLAHWRATGENPWQSPEHVEIVGEATARLIRKYSHPGDAVLDAGCAMGDLLARIVDRERFGCDFNEDYLEVARSRGIEAIYAELEKLPYSDGSFDLVVTTDVLEHVQDLNAVLSEMLRVLKQAGVLVIRSPDSEDLSVYLGRQATYRFVHLRRFDNASFRLLLDRVFECDVLETFTVRQEICIAARKR